MEGVHELRKRWPGGRPRGSGLKLKKREEEIEQLLENNKELLSLSGDILVKKKVSIDSCFKKCC